MSENKDFNHLGSDYQNQLINEILTDKSFAEKIVEILEPSYFTREALQKLVVLIKNYYKEHDSIPTFNTLDTEIRINTQNNDAFRDQLLESLTNIKSLTDINYNVQKVALDFCKLKKVTKAIVDIHKKLQKEGSYVDYNVIEAQIKDAITFKEDDEVFEFYDNIDDIFDEEASEPIPTGLQQLDDCLKYGGLLKKTLGLLVAPTGTGKTTLFTIFALNAYLAGKNVLHIIFEDAKTALKRKYANAAFKASDEELYQIKDQVLAFTKELKQRPNKLHTIKYNSDGSVTPTHIKKLIKKLNASNPTIDVVLIDYIDCMDLEHEARTNDTNINEGKLIRRIETIGEEFNVAIWAATQGNRTSIDKETVSMDQVGGTIKKVQAASVILVIAKTQNDRDQKTGTLTIAKNRTGKDGIEFRGVHFDNERCHIDLGKKFTIEGFEQEVKGAKVSEAKDKRVDNMLANAMMKYKQSKETKKEEIKKIENSEDDFVLVG